MLQVPAILGSLPATAAEELTFRGNLTWINAYVHLITDDEYPLNQDNQVLQVPENSLVSELRPNIKITSSSFQLVARPKVVIEATRVKSGDEYADATGRTRSTVNEAFFNWNVSNSVLFSYGRQSYQWGGAEAINASNRIFHETSQSRNILYEVIGRDIARINFTLGKSFSTVLMTEFQENEDEEAFRYGQEFASAGLIKSELTWNNGTDYFGVVLGGREGGRGWVGEYLSLQMPFFEGLFLYGDASHQRGSAVWYPVSTQVATQAGPATVIDMQQSQIESDKTYTLATVGARYDFENGTIVRIEYIKNDAGYTEEERDLFFAGLAAQNPAQAALTQVNAAKFQRSGTEFPGQKYGYASLNVPDFLTIRDLGFFTRALYSLTDNSSNTYVSFDYLVGDAGTLSLAGSADAGADHSELRSAVKNSYILAYKHNW
jgi:hypothetical protein